MMNFSVVICTYNGEHRLPEVLERLCSQEQTENLAWEILVIDNNSTDQTQKVVQEYQSEFSKKSPKIRYCFEPKQGIAFARRLAIQEAQSPLIGFLDDDNLPHLNWVYSAYLFAQSHPKAGAYGSQLEALYEANPPENFHRIACFLAIINRGREAFRYDLLERWLFPPGAGLVVRKQAWLDCVPEHPFFTGVSAKSLNNKGEDIEILSYLRKTGWEIWHNPQMIVDHHIPNSRLQKSYLLKLLRGIGLSRYYTRMLQLPTWKKPLFTVIYLLNDLRKLIVHYWTHYKVLNTDIVSRCELELYWSSLISPFYYWLKA
ncbi:hormogonium polysaccharide biosynthesis glycosyltransferase HpsE [Lyngbya sp. PCC 8106]|uniref:hormogonium polysaccharide biosynthesis glycosyltransferase HpsE n=1 Tax=Lyngbya sp. (strain PCC 8106) TaxID=313612 RepID=UPI000312CCFA|nr:hormogonium polysaccharide biosynthesis glycosyltransferase HpsE [Lyngbya sp. PCC 8106]